MAKGQQPAPHGFIPNIDPALCEQIFDIARAERKPKIQPDGILDDVKREAVAVVADRVHAAGLSSRSIRVAVTMPCGVPCVLGGGLK